MAFTRPGRPRADGQALCQRALAVAKLATARFTAPNDASVVCECIGQPHSEAEPSPLVDECVRNIDLWRLPPCAERIRLAFLWEIIAQGDTIATKGGCCVVRLDHAERQGVPLPLELVPHVEAVTEVGGEHNGA